MNSIKLQNYLHFFDHHFIECTVSIQKSGISRVYLKVKNRSYFAAWCLENNSLPIKNDPAKKAEVRIENSINAINRGSPVKYDGSHLQLRIYIHRLNKFVIDEQEHNL